MITKIFNTRLRGESFTHNLLTISRLKAKNRAVKAEKRKLVEFARNARAKERTSGGGGGGADDGRHKQRDGREQRRDD